MRDSPLSSSRVHYLDNIRSVIIVFVVLFHGILPYTEVCPWWYVIDPEPIPFSFFFIIFLDPILMPILFFIAGLLAWPSFERKGAYLFMAGKVKRLVIPFLLCTFLFSPIMPFIRQSLRTAGSVGDPVGFWPFWLSFLKSGATIHSGSVATSSDIVVNQYWFLMLLFLFFAGFCLCARMRGGFHNKSSVLVAEVPSSRSAWLSLIILYSLVLGVIYAFICLFFDGSVWVILGGLWQIQPAKVPIYLGFFLAGIYIERRELLPSLLDIAKPVVWFSVAALLTVAYFTAVILTFGAEDPSATLVITSRFLRLLFMMAVSLWLLSFFHHRFNNNRLFWRELSSNSYNIYLIHLVPQVVLQMLALSWPIPSLLKFVAVSLLTLSVSYLSSRYLVKKSSTSTILVLILVFIFMILAFS